MKKWIDFSVDASSWAAVSRAVPGTFPTGTCSFCFPLSEVLLIIGLVTIPGSASGISLAEYWAWLRYFSCVDDGRKLALNAFCNELDSHQKTILSDDFGMGFAFYCMKELLEFEEFCDGAYFEKRLLRKLGGHYIGKVAKSGARKTPDFVCKSYGPDFYHQIECKGTQSSYSALNKQIQAGMTQIKNMSFPAAVSGERIVVGTLVECSGKDHDSKIVVADPEWQAELVLSEQDLPIADDALVRGMVGKLLCAAGLPSTSSVIMDPDGGVDYAERLDLPDSHVDSLRRQASKRKENAVTELRRGSMQQFSIGSGVFMGREAVINFNLPVIVNGLEFSSAIIRQGVEKSAINGISINDIDSEDIGKSCPGLRRNGKITSKSENGFSELRIGGNFYSSLELI
ncbi:hypothetical protein [Azospirillum tabaci]|uniref:hypothetical protein n=1 Tax=Azospirillum tabaci TaxID=2752310 RepID=UPI00166077FA|nr:hypothetical protein [Azospirillum tabaci]